MAVPRVIRGGKVAILISPQYGAGWSSWNRGCGDTSERMEEIHDMLLFHPKLVHMVEQGDADKITEEWMTTELGIQPEEMPYLGGADTLRIAWLRQGTPFMIDEHDGYETLATSDNLVCVA